MATITNTSTVSRTRADRSSAAVVAGYIRELAAAPAGAQGRTFAAMSGGSAGASAGASAAADALDASQRTGFARGRAVESGVRRAARLGRSERGGCSRRAARAHSAL